MPPIVIQQMDGEEGGMPHPGPLPTMPTAVRVTVPQRFFHSRGNHFPIRVTSSKYGRNSQAGRICDSFAPPTSIFVTSSTWAALISSWISRNVLRLAARTMQGRTCGWPAISRSIQVNTSTSLNRMRWWRPFQRACTYRCSSTARPKQPIMNAVNEGDSPVRAFTSRRYARVLVIDFEQAMHHRLVVGGADRLPHEAPALRVRDHVVFTLLLHRLLTPFKGSIPLPERLTSS